MKLLIIHGGSWYDARGGAEKQIELIKQQCVNAGHKVFHLSVNSTNEQLPFYQEMDNGSLYSISVKRFWIARFIMFLRLCKQLQPDIIYTRSYWFMNFSFFAKLIFKIPLVYNLSSDRVCRPIFKSGNISKWRLLKRGNTYKLILTHFLLPCIDQVVTQTRYQQELLLKSFGVKSVVISNGHVVPEGVFKKEIPPVVVWIANIKKWKRPEIFIDLAKDLSKTGAYFVFAGRPNRGALQKKMEQAIQRTPNLKYLGELSFEETDELLSKASLFVNTSEPREGFPNTFIQAWMRETPVVTLAFDPDNLIKEKHLGFHSDNYTQLIKDIKFLLENHNEIHKMGQTARKYATSNHNIIVTGKEYMDLFLSLTKQ